MRRLILFLFLIFSNLLYSQTVVWESEYQLSKCIWSTKHPVILDSEGNIVSLGNDIDLPIVNSYFFKYDTLGNLMSSKQIYNGNLLIPLSLYEINGGYRIFHATSDKPNGDEDALLPLIIHTNMEGDTINTLCPYNIKHSKNNKAYSDSGFVLGVLTLNNTVNVGRDFYNACIKESIPYTETSYLEKYHIIFNCYDSTGKIKWRKGYDSLGGPNPDPNVESYNEQGLYSIKYTNAGTFLILVTKYKNFGQIYFTEIKLLETDIEGNVLKGFEFPGHEKKFYSVDVVRLNDGSYVILGKYLDADPNNYFLWKINPEGEIVKTKEIPHKYIYSYLNKLELTPDGDILIYGTVLIDEKTQGNIYDNVKRIYMFKMNTELEYEWEFEWYEHEFLYSTEFQNILFLDKNNFIAVGWKDTYKFYIAKINIPDTTTAVKERREGAISVSVQPVPFTDFCEIAIDNLGGKNLTVELYDMMGNKISTIHRSSPADAIKQSFIISGRNLTAGVYFVSVKYGNEVYRKKIVKVE